MTAREFLTNLTIILAIMAIGALIETALPLTSDVVTVSS
jgi:hypothetical protein